MREISFPRVMISMSVNIKIRMAISDVHHIRAHSPSVGNPPPALGSDL